jgi:hypothetical protein
MVSLYNKVIVDFSLAKRFFIDPPGADNFIVSFIRYYGITADRYEDAIKIIEEDVRTEGELFYAECAEVSYDEIRPKLFNTDLSFFTAGIWHRSGRILLCQSMRDDEERKIGKDPDLFPDQEN